MDKTGKKKEYKRESDSLKLMIKGIDFDIDHRLTEEDIKKAPKGTVADWKLTIRKLQEDVIANITADFEEERDYGEVPEEVDSVRKYITHKGIDVNKMLEDAKLDYYKQTILGLPKEIVIDYPISQSIIEKDIKKEEVVAFLEDKYGYPVKADKDFRFAKARGTDIAKQNIKDGIENIIRSDSFHEFLDLSKNFENYSFSNKMLVFSQCPNATLVKGMKKWSEEFERNVKKGEKAIWIYVPIKRFFKDEEKLLEYIEKSNNQNPYGTDSYYYITDKMKEEFRKTLKEKGEVSIMKGFNVTPVFDISQTEGKEIEYSFIKNINKEMENYEEVKNALVNVCSDNKVAVSFVEKEQDSRLNNAYGYFNAKEDKIVVSLTDRSEQDRIKTLIHETAHSLLHGNEMKVLGITSSNSNMVSSSIKEVEAEAVAYIVCQNLGIDSSMRSFGYIAEYLPLDKKLRDEAFENSYKRIDECAKHIVRDLDKYYKKDLTAEKEDAKAVLEPIEEGKTDNDLEIEVS